MTLQRHPGYSVTARIRHPPHRNDDDRADSHPRTTGETAGERIEVRVVDQHDPARAVQTQDPRRAREGTEHDDNPAVLPEMSNRLDTAPCLVEEGDRALIENGELAAVALV